MTGKDERPNIIIILADDLGFSDVGCFGSEIETPNIDSLAYSPAGIRFTQMYNCSRCCPSRASLLTGLYPHQAGIGHMVYNAGVGKEYQGYLRQDVRTIADMLKNRHRPNSTEGMVEIDDETKDSGGYDTYMVGKWHVGGDYPPDASHEWIQKTMGDAAHPTPTQCGFDKFYGTLGGGGSYYQPPSLVRDDMVVKETLSDGYYYTDAITDEACAIIGGMSKMETEDRKPFFMYVAHCAPHWPLHVPNDELQKQCGSYMCGWDAVRERRHARLIEQGIIPATWQCSPRDEYSPPWESVSNKEWEDARMACYSAQITILDRGVGRILESLQNTGHYENTVIFFLSDNGGCAEYLKENGEEGHFTEFYGGLTRTGQQITVGNDPSLMPGPENTFMSYGLSWANASNTPFRLFKSFVHEGGISTPFIVHWPAAVPSEEDDQHDRYGSTNNCGRICHSPWIMMDIVATCCDLADSRNALDELEGESFLPILQETDDVTRTKPIYWEHQGNCAVREGKWKLVRRRVGNNVEQLDGKECKKYSELDVTGWELYNMDVDRTELHNLALQNQERVQSMARDWSEWASRVGVKSWPLKPLAKGDRDWSNVPWLW